MALNGGPFDRFSLLHAGVGVWVGARGFGFVPALLLHTAWELFEAFVMERASPDKFVFQREPFSNRVGDTVAFLAGWSLNLGDRLKDDPWIGEVNPVRLVYTPRVSSMPLQLDPRNFRTVRLPGARTSQR